MLSLPSNIEASVMFPTFWTIAHALHTVPSLFSTKS
jgi:hypothetical protein